MTNPTNKRIFTILDKLGKTQFSDIERRYALFPRRINKQWVWFDHYWVEYQCTVVGHHTGNKCLYTDYDYLMRELQGELDYRSRPLLKRKRKI